MPTSPEIYDAIVIGTGQAGPSLAVRLAGAGKRTAIIERKHVGGTCVNVGCIPTKTLIASARAAHVARHAADYGVLVGGAVTVDMARVKARKDEVVAASSTGLTKWLEGTGNLSLIHGHARFESARRLRVTGQSGERVIEVADGGQVFINTGGRAVAPDIPGLSGIDYLTNSSMMEVDTLPRHLLIIGGSYIGLEFAQMYRRFGSDVTVLEVGPRIIGREDEPVSAAIQTILAGEGVAFHTGVQDLHTAKTADGGVTLNFKTGDAQHSVAGSHLLLAVGRAPNTDDLGLEHAGVKLDARGYITVDEQLRSSVPGIWALGDVNGRGAFTHTAYNDYEIVAANLLDNDPRKLSDRIPIYALFTDPPLARVGMSEKEVRASGRPALVGRMQMARVGRARERGETAGFMTVLIDAETKHFLGAALLGIEADEAIHAIADLMYAGAPYTVMQRAVHIHPTVSELLPTLLGDLKPL